MIYDLLFEMLYAYNFEMIFWKHLHSQKRLCWPSFWNYFLFEIGSAQSAKTVFYVLRFEMIYDCHFEMSKAFLFSFWNALWLSFWNEGGKNFRTQKNFRQENLKYFIDENLLFRIFFVHSFLRSVNVPTLALKNILLWREGLQCQILM